MGITFKDVKNFATAVGVCTLSPAFCVIAAFSGCDSSKPTSSTPTPEPVTQKNPIDQYVSQCDDAVKRMSEAAACGQYQYNSHWGKYPSSTSLHIPQNNTQQDVEQLVLSGQCMIKCAWDAPAQPKYKRSGGLCEYILRVSHDLTSHNGGPKIYDSTITTEKSRAYDYFEFCLGHGYLP